MRVEAAPKSRRLQMMARVQLDASHVSKSVTARREKVTRYIRVLNELSEVRAFYNILLGRPSINRLMAIVSTPHLAMKFPSRTWDILTVHVDQKEERECYAKSLRVEPLRADTSPLRVRKPSRKDRSPRKDRPREIKPTVALVDLDPRATEDRLEAREELRRVPLLDEEHNTAVGTTFAATEAETMHATLKKNIDMFAWTPVDMPGVSPDVITHRLSIFKEARPSPKRRGTWATKSDSRRRRRPVSSCRSGS